MNKKEILEQTRAFVRKEMDGEGSGHDWWHIDRVTKTALTIGTRMAQEGDLFMPQFWISS